MKIFYISALCLISVSAYTQLKLRDSLRLLLKETKHDTSRADLLCQLSFNYAESQPDTAMLLATQALSISQRAHHLPTQAFSFLCIGLIYTNSGNYAKSLQANFKALELFEQSNNFYGESAILNNLGYCYLLQEDYNQAIVYLKKSIQVQETRDPTLNSIALSNLGTCYLGLNQLDSARLFQHSAYEIATKIKNSREIGGSLKRLGDTYLKSDDYNLALEFYRKGIPHLIVSHNELFLSETYLGLANLFRSTNQKDSSIQYANKTFSISQKNGFTKQIFESSTFLVSSYKEMKNVDSAFRYLELAREANDSMYNQQKVKQFQNHELDEKLKVAEAEAALMKEKQERKQKLQLAAIAIGILTLIVMFFALSRSVIVKDKFIRFFGVLILLAVFEFINLLIHPYISAWTHHSTLRMLLILIAIGALLIPIHHKMEKWIIGILVEKNKKIRLAAAKKTIATLEG